MSCALAQLISGEVQEAPRDVAIDPINQKIYWTALCCGIRRADLNGTNEEVPRWVKGPYFFFCGYQFFLI